MQADIQSVLIDRAAIAQRLDQMSRQIVADLHGAADLTLVPILTGSIIFVSDLIRRIPLKMRIRVMSVTSYPGTATTSRGAAVEAALDKVPQSLAGQHVLVVDDILDSGGTLRLVVDTLRRRGPADLRTCVLLRKQIPSAVATPVDYVAFDIPDHFVVGYGLDYDDYYRNLPDICTLRPEVVRAGS
ncbi:MAG: hypoxanthine phosphoribosyltransferase [Phycisphaeraceae bacterium]|nr:hypoxanthine phosphoribosyltransferase [Phycisphaeraceae bacterium]